MSSLQARRASKKSYSSLSSLIVFGLVCSSLPSSASSSRTNAGAAALDALKTMDLRYFVAGGTCAAISHGITTPIDVVKTRIQANPEVYDKGMVAAAASIIQKEGPGALLSGLGPTVVGYGVEGAMKFGLYEVGKPVFGALLNSRKAVGEAADIPPLAFILASVLAGAIAAVLLCPMESLRIKQVTDEEYANTSLMTGLPKLMQTDGMTALFGGLLAMLVKQIPYTFGKQVSFDVIAKVLYAAMERVKEMENVVTALLTSPAVLKWVVSILAAAMASVVACLMSQPGDMILTETYKSHSPHAHTTATMTPTVTATNTAEPTTQLTTDSTADATTEPTTDMLPSATTTTETVPATRTDPELTSLSPQTFATVIQAIYARGGSTEFFRGLQARLLHVGMIITSQLVIYDIVKQLLGLPATGSH